MTPENREILLLTKGPEQILRLGLNQIRAFKSRLNLLLRVATRPCRMMLLGCLVQRGASHVVIERNAFAWTQASVRGRIQLPLRLTADGKIQVSYYRSLMPLGIPTLDFKA